MSISRVQITSNQSLGNSVGALSSATISTAATFTSNNTLGNTIFAMVAAGCNAAACLGIVSPSVSDTQGNVWTQVGWLGGGTQSGGSIGLYMAPVIHAGANTVTFSYTAQCNCAVGGNFDGMLVISEYSGMGTAAAQGFSANHFYGGAGGAQSLTVTDSNGATVAVTFPSTGTDTAIMLADITSGAANYLIAGMRNGVASTPTSTYATFTLAGSTSASDILRYFDAGSPFANTQPQRGNIDWDQIGSDARQGSTWGTKVQYADGTFTTGNLPRYKNDGTLEDSGISAPGSGGAGYATKSAVQQEAYTYAADTGTANAYAVTLSPTPTLVAGSQVIFKATNANTGASTLAVNGGTATAIKKSGSTALASGDIAAGQIIKVIYDGTNWQLIGGSGGGSGGGAFIGASAYNSGSQSIPNNSNAALTFDTNSWDTSSIHSTTSNTSRFTAPTAGYYLCAGGFVLNSGTGYSNFQIYVNGSHAVPASVSVNNSSAIGLTASAVLKLNSGDYVEFIVYQNTGSSQTVQTGYAWGQITQIQGGGSGGGALVLLEQHTAASSAELDFTSCISSTYDEYVIECINVVPATANTSLLVQFSTNGGTSYDATAADYVSGYHYSRMDSASSGDNQSTTKAGMWLGDINGTAQPGKSITARLYNPGGSNYKETSWHGVGAASGSSMWAESGGAAWLSTSAANAFRILMSSGNIASGTVRVYGVAKTAGGGSGMTLISDQTLASAAATVTFSSIPNTYKHLKLVVTCACSGAVTADHLYMQVNGDAGSNYWTQLGYANNTSPGAFDQNALAKADLGIIPGTSSLANSASVFEIIISSYTGAFLKSALVNVGAISGASLANNMYRYANSWTWNNNAAITSITFGVQGGSNFVAGSEFSLYGF